MREKLIIHFLLALFVMWGFAEVVTFIAEGFNDVIATYAENSLKSGDPEIDAMMQETLSPENSWNDWND